MDRSDGLTILLIRHAEAAPPEKGAERERERPLTERGLRDAKILADSLAAVKLDWIYCSPYRRAIQTLEPLANRHALEIEPIENLRERLLSPDALPNWREHLRRGWRDFDYAPAGGESSAVAQARVTSVFEDLRHRHRAGVAVVGSHGNLISLALHALEPSVDYDFWSAMPLPAVYRIDHRDGRGPIISGPSV